MKKNILIFVGGFICGGIATFLLMILFGVAASQMESNKLSGLVLSEAKGDCISRNNSTVLQPLTPTAVLANKRVKTSYGMMNDGIMLLLVDNERLFYDNEEIKLPQGKCFRQKGIFKYTNRDGISLTVPAVKID